MAEIILRDLHLTKKALAVAILVIERMDGPFKSESDMADMKHLLDRLIQGDEELAHYLQAAKTIVNGMDG